MWWHIECGPNPKIHYTVKNYRSGIDPVYNERVNNTIKVIPNINISKGDKIEHLGITIDGNTYSFSFDNVFECKTAGGIKFYCCIDICLDHAYAVARKRLNKKLDMAVKADPNIAGELLPIYCSHILTSNTIDVQKENSLGMITHADPAHSRRDLEIMLI